MSPIYSIMGQLVGWLSGNVVFGADGKNVAFVRNGRIYSNASEYLGRLSYVRDRLIWEDLSKTRE